MSSKDSSTVWIRGKSGDYIKTLPIDIYCKECKAHFSERKGMVLEQARLNEDKVVSILEHLRERYGTRATGRLVSVSNGTVSRYIKKSGQVAENFHNEQMAFPP